MKKLFFSLIIITITFSSYAQTQTMAPTLQVGLSGINFTKGTLDPELVALIIAEKQREIKVRLIKSMLLDKLGIDNGLFYTFIDNSIDIITKESDEETRIKNLLENTVNLAFIVAYTQYYLRTAAGDELTNLKALSDTINPKVTEYYFPDSGKTDINTINFKETTKNENKIANDLDTVKLNSDKNKFLSLLVDMASENVRESSFLKQIGLMRTNYLQNYSSLNSYLHELNNGVEVDLKIPLKAVFEDSQKKLDMFVVNAGFFKSLRSLGNFQKIEKISDILKKVEAIIDCDDPCKIKSIKVVNDLILDANKEAADQYVNYTPLENSQRDLINGFREKLTYIALNPDEQLAYYEKEIKPSLIALSKYSNKYADILKLVSIGTFFSQNNINAIKDVEISLNDPFFLLVTKLNEFDRVETYSDFLNQLSDAGDAFSSEGMRASINQVISFIRGYIKIAKDVKDKPAITMDVEGFIISLQRLSYNKWRPIQLHFTVGANNMAFAKSYQISDDTSIKNYSYIGEKIGIKFKFFDFAYTRSFPRGETFGYYGMRYTRIKPPKDPVVSNIHVLLYGSGILYNIVNTGTTENFNRPVVAAGAGITFFNNLDLNLSWGQAIDRKKSLFGTPSLFNVGFDIQIGEYLDRLNKRHKENQTYKKIEEARSL